MSRAAVAALCLTAASCAAKGVPPSGPQGAGPAVGVYRISVEEPGRSARHARLLLWAAAPDRLHADLLGPVGGVRFSLDAGGGRLCLVDSDAGIAYVGDDESAAIRVVAGVDLSVGEAVAALLYGTAGPDLAVRREGDPPGVLPSKLRVERAGRALTLDRLRTERAAPEAPLGTGTPPASLRVRPLSELRAEEADGDGS